MGVITYKGAVSRKDILYCLKVSVASTVNQERLEIIISQLEDVTSKDNLCENHLQKYLEVVGEFYHHTKIEIQII